MRLCVLLFVLAAAACARPTTYVDVNLNDEDVAPFRQQGTASIEGQAFLRQRGGGVVTCAGAEVHLLPDLPPIRTSLQAISNGHQVARAGATTLHGTNRSAQCDAQGNFAFTKLPAASWHVLTLVTWEVGRRRQGGALAARVTTTEGGRATLLLTGDNQIYP